VEFFFINVNLLVVNFNHTVPWPHLRRGASVIELIRNGGCGSLVGEGDGVSLSLDASEGGDGEDSERRKDSEHDEDVRVGGGSAWRSVARTRRSWLLRVWKDERSWCITVSNLQLLYALWQLAIPWEPVCNQSGRTQRQCLHQYLVTCVCAFSRPSIYAVGRP
jgi:hypothetical protein